MDEGRGRAMAVQFILGRPGAGRSALCLEAIAAACRAEPLGPPLLLLVPEQASYTAEKSLLQQPGLAGYTRAQVLSFTRLAEYVAAASPLRPARPLTAAHRDVLVTLLVAEEQRRGETPLATLRGLEEALADFVAETREHAVEPADLLALAEQVDLEARVHPGRALLAAKLRQLAHLLTRWHTVLAGRFEDPADTMRALADQLATTPAMEGAAVWLDGFWGFTPMEEPVLVALARRAVRLTITLAIDPDRAAAIAAGTTPPRWAPAAPVEETYHTLLRLFADNGIAVDPPICLTPNPAPRFRAPVLDFVARHFLAAPALYDQPLNDAVRFIECASHADELRLAAEIVREWTATRGWHPGEVGILCRDLAADGDAIARALATLNLPCFVDRHVPLADHPLVAGLRSLVAAAHQPHEPAHLIRLARSGFLALPRRDGDRLAWHLAEYPRPAKRWYDDDDWQPPAVRRIADEEDAPLETMPFDPRIDAARRHVAAAVARFRHDIGATDDPEAPVDGAVYTEALAAAIATHAAPRMTDGDALNVLRRVGEALGVLRQLTSGTTHPPRVLADALLRVLDRLTHPGIPPLLGQVFVGQVDRSRQPPLRGVVLVGLDEGVMPRIQRTHSLVNEGEREVLEGMGLRLRPSGARQFQREALHAHRAIASPSDALVLLRARGEGEEEPRRPSPFWLDLLGRLPAARVESAPPPDAPARVWRAREWAAAALRRLAGAHLPGGPTQALPDLAALWGAPPPAEAAAVAAMAAWRNTAVLPPGRLYTHLGGRLSISASRLEGFAVCPFRAFSQSLLRPHVRLRPEFEGRDAGEFAHAVLSQFTGLLAESGLAGDPLDDEAFEDLFETALEGPNNQLRHLHLLDSPRGRYLHELLVPQLRDVARMIVDHYARFNLRPIAHEVAFVFESAESAPERFPAPRPGWTIRFAGRIDRVDAVGTSPDHATTALVVDYKLSERKPNFADLYSGIELQLPLYLVALRQGAAGRPLDPAGAVFMPLLVKSTEPGRTLDGLCARSAIVDIFPDKPRFSRLAPFRSPGSDPAERDTGRGAVVPDALLARIVDHARNTAERLIDRLIAGDIAVRPLMDKEDSAPCSRCDHRPICRIDRAVEPPRRRPVMSRPDVVARLTPPPAEAAL